VVVAGGIDGVAKRNSQTNFGKDENFMRSTNENKLFGHLPVPLVALSKAWVCGLIFAGIAVLNSLGGVAVLL
jgi:hypothetical protein